MSTPTLIYVPRDAAALAMDADAVAAAIELAADERGLAVQVVRNGSRGLLWLEPLVEISTPEGRLAYGPVPVSYTHLRAWPPAPGRPAA